MNKTKIKNMSLYALFTAIIAACAWISISTPFGVNLSFSLFGVCLASCCLGLKGGLLSTVTYILLGVTGLPVFSQFSGGIGVLLGPSGGFIWGFLLVAVLCGVATNIKNQPLSYLLCIISVLICHISGVIQFYFVTNNSILASFLYASLPFLFKDVLLAILAYIISKKIKSQF